MLNAPLPLQTRAAQIGAGFSPPGCQVKVRSGKLTWCSRCVCGDVAVGLQTFFTRTAFMPFWPRSNSNFTLVPSLTSSSNPLTCTKNRSWVPSSLMKPKPLEVSKKSTLPTRSALTSSAAVRLGTPSSISEASMMIFCLVAIPSPDLPKPHARVSP